MSIRLIRVTAVAALATLTACSQEAFTVKYAQRFSPVGQHVSFFAIKRDGLLNPSGWGALGPNVSAPFSEQDCELGWSETSLAAMPALESAIGDYARTHGVTDELLEQVAPAAKGDVLILLTIAGHPPQPSGTGLGSPTQSAAQGSRMGAGRGARGNATASKATRFEEAAGDDALEVSAYLFSAREHRSVGLIVLRYSGINIDKALRHFVQRLQSELPRASCAGWNWSAVHETSIQNLPPP